MEKHGKTENPLKIAYRGFTATPSRICDGPNIMVNLAYKHEVRISVTSQAIIQSDHNWPGWLNVQEVLSASLCMMHGVPTVLFITTHHVLVIYCYTPY